MAFLANHVSLATQEGVDETPTNYTPLVGEALIGQGVGPSSQLDQPGGSFPYVQPGRLVPGSVYTHSGCGHFDASAYRLCFLCA